MPDSGTRPLLTMAVCSYNQEQYVRAAIEAAFAQTYAPLQIILSDDCSRDRSYDIMCEMAAAYRGPHEITLNRNAVNAGLGAHTNRIGALTKGQFMIMAAGDDISLPNRVEVTYQAWEASGRKARGVHGKVVHMDENGRVQEDPDFKVKGFTTEDGLPVLKNYLRTATPVILGCTTAWSRELFDTFGPIPNEVVFEDMALGFRARMLGGMAFVDAPLVLYRLHSSNIHHADVNADATVENLRAEEKRHKLVLERKLVVAKSFRADLVVAQKKNLLSAAEHAELRAEVERFERANAVELDFCKTHLLRRMALYSEVSRRRRANYTHSANISHYLLPRWGYYAGRILKNRLRRMTQSSSA